MYVHKINMYICMYVCYGALSLPTLYSQVLSNLQLTHGSSYSLSLSIDLLVHSSSSSSQLNIGPEIALICELFSYSCYYCDPLLCMFVCVNMLRCCLSLCSSFMQCMSHIYALNTEYKYFIVRGVYTCRYSITLFLSI